MSIKQCTSNILMVKPAVFGFNKGTANDNVFQNKPEQENININELAIEEFTNAVKLFSDNNINIIEIIDNDDPVKPDAIFPNNWFSTHEDGTLILYPMYASSRRSERRSDIINELKDKFQITNQIDYSKFENEELFLEGTGSMVLDRQNKICYAAISKRTNKKLLDEFCSQMGYNKVSFDARDENGIQIYHTNVLMSVAEKFVVICLDAIKNENEKKELLSKFKETNKDIIPISLNQMRAFSGNVLGVKDNVGENCFVMSENAFNSFTKDQIDIIEKSEKIIKVPIPTIEKIGGGGIRCMMAEVFFKEKY